MGDLHERLADPFPPNVIGWKAQSVKGGRALAVAYIEARDVMNRLDRVVGPENWWARYDRLDGGNVECHLTVRVGDREVTKSDVGGESDQPDPGDKLKAAYSDALKRAAVHWGVGRYLYYLPRTWCDYDPATKQIANPPALPHWALPRKTTSPDAAPQQQPAALPAPEEAAPEPTSAVSREEAKLFFAQMARKNQTWVTCMQWLTAATGTDYPSSTRVSTLPRDHWDRLVAAVQSMPDAPKE